MTKDPRCALGVNTPISYSRPACKGGGCCLALNCIGSGDDLYPDLPRGLAFGRSGGVAIGGSLTGGFFHFFHCCRGLARDVRKRVTRRDVAPSIFVVDKIGRNGCLTHATTSVASLVTVPCQIFASQLCAVALGTASTTASVVVMLLGLE